MGLIVARHYAPKLHSNGLYTTIGRVRIRWGHTHQRWGQRRPTTTLGGPVLLKVLRREIAGVVVPFYSPSDHPHFHDDQPNAPKLHAVTNRWCRRDSSGGRARPSSSERCATRVLAVGAFDREWSCRHVAV
jgi:hypothetical protein